MPVRVDVPIRLKVDAVALNQRQEAVCEALAAALLRALTKSRRHVLDRRGGYVGVRQHPPTFAWHGAGLAEVGLEARVELEQRVVALVAAASEQAGLFDAAEAAAEAPWPLESEPAEPYDRTRRARLSHYRIPFFDDPDAAGDVPLEDEEPLAPLPGLPVDRWAIYFDPLLGEDNLDFRRYLLQQAMARYGEPSTLVAGLIWNTGTELVFLVQDFGTDKVYPAYTVDIENLVSYEFQGFNASPPWRLVRGAPEPSAVNARFFGPYNADQRADAIRDLMGGAIRRDIVQSGQAGLLRDEEIEQQLEVEVQRRAEGLPSEAFRILQLAFVQRTLLLIGNPEEAWEGDATLLPVTYTDIVMPGEGGEAGRGGAGGPGEGGETAGTGAPGGAEGQGTGEGGGVILGGEPGSEGGSMFPQSSYSSGGEYDCSPLLDEPPLDDLPEDKAARLQRQMEEIAYRLQIPVCGHAARFCVNAASAVGSRAAGVAEAAVREDNLSQPLTAAAPGSSNNLGAVHFAPFPSPAIQLLRHLAATVPLIHAMAEEMMYIYAAPDVRSKIGGSWGNDPAGWNLHFYLEFSPVLDRSVAFVFGYSCQILLLQLLRGSRQAIDERLDNLTNYAANFELVILPQLVKVEELLALRARLQTYSRLVRVGQALDKATGTPVFDVARLSGLEPAAAWLEATRGVTAAIVEANRAHPQEGGERGQIVVEDGTVRIFDSEGRLWTLPALEAAIAMRRGTLEEIDPLIKQFTDLPEVMERLRSGSVRAELGALLGEMSRANREKIAEAEANWQFAFRASRISEGFTAETLPGTSFILQGIHLMAHEQVGEFFHGDLYYGRGVDALLGAELGWQSLSMFFEFTGLILLAIVCPPLAVGAGILLAAYQYEQALEREELYRALIDPELVLTWSEVEVELFAARLGLALAFIPEAGSLLGRGAASVAGVGVRGSARAAASSTRLALRGGVRGASLAATRYLGRATIHSLERGAIRALLEEIASDRVMDRLVTQVLTPVLEAVEREAAASGPTGGYAGAERFLARLEQEAREQERAPSLGERLGSAEDVQEDEAGAAPAAEDEE